MKRLTVIIGEAGLRRLIDQEVIEQREDPHVMIQLNRSNEDLVMMVGIEGWDVGADLEGDEID